VEIGASLAYRPFLAAAVRDNFGAAGGSGVVIGTEYEPAKAKAARALFARVGLAGHIDLREGGTSPGPTPARAYQAGKHGPLSQDRGRRCHGDSGADRHLKRTDDATGGGGARRPRPEVDVRR
jgi:hypothetical protein